MGELATDLPVSRPAVSQHLKILKKAGLVIDESLGTRNYYHIDPRGLDGLRDYLDGFWDGVLTAFKEAVESPRGGGNGSKDTED